MIHNSIKKILVSAGKFILPHTLKSKINNYYERKFRNKRKKVEEEIPSVPLTQKHIQNCEVLLDRSHLISKLKKNGVVSEIGVAKGDFSKIIFENAKPEVLHLIDIWDSKRYHDGYYKMVKSIFSEEIKEGCVKIHRKFSAEAADDFEDNYFDWIYIDSDHTYKVTWEELVKYAPKVKKEGIIAGHDYTIGNWTKSLRYGVIEAVHKFCVKHNWEIVYITLDRSKGNQSFAIRRIKDDR